MNRYLEHDWFPEPLPENVVLGERTWLYSTFAFRHYQSRQAVGLRTGHDTGLYNGTFFDLGPSGEVVIGDYCTLVGAIICSNRRIEIGDYAFIAHEVVMADTFDAVPCRLPTQQFAPGAPLDRSEPGISLGENVWIGARAILLGGARVGPGAIVAAASVVDFCVPAYTVVAGNPARIVKEIDH